VGGAGTQFTCFTSPKVQIMAPERGWRTRGGRSRQELALTLLALLVQKYTYRPQFTCFVGTQLQILTESTGFNGTKVQILTQMYCGAGGF
jgi:hypothetical protein